MGCPVAEANRVAAGRVVIVGAGWAGLAAALELSEIRPASEIWLYERRSHPGGRAFSFTHPTTGWRLDNGQHVLLGCCTEFVAALRQIGQEDAVRFQPLLSVPVYASGAWQTLKSRRLPGPLHLLQSLMGYGHLSPAERARALWAALAVLTGSTERIDGQSFASWLAEHGQSTRAIERLWDLIGVAVLNGSSDKVSAGLAVQALRTGVVSGWRAARLGYFACPLSDLAEAAVRVLRSRGVHVHLGEAIERVELERGAVVGVRTKAGERVAAQTVIAAVPHDVLPRLLIHDLARSSELHGLASVPWSPIVNVYLLYDRPVMTGEVAAWAGQTAPFVFNRGRLLGTTEWDGRLLAASISAAGSLLGQSRQQLVRQVDQQVRQMFPEAGAARLLQAVCVWQTQATFLAEPGIRQYRFPCQGLVPGLLVAGDWTDTGWPACLEGAVRSGRTAARLAVNSRCIQEKAYNV